MMSFFGSERIEREKEMATEDIYKEKRVEENKGGRESGFWIPIDCLQIDTKDILFICGGAFVDIEKTISERHHDSSIGFGAPVRANMRMGGVTNAAVTSNLMETVESSDLMKTKQEVVHLRQDGGWHCWS